MAATVDSVRRDPFEELRARLGRAGDRLYLALFLAALLHAAVILGVRFAAPGPEREPLPTLEVLLVPEGPDAPDPNADAAYIAQRAQRGSGTTRAPLRASLPESAASALDQAGDERGDAPLPLEREQLEGGSSVVTTRVERAPVRLQPGEQADAQRSLRPQASRPLPQVGVNARAADENLRLRGDPAEDGRLLADTRASQIAEYSDAWKRRIERAGTLDFPAEALQLGATANPVLEVVIRADGSLKSVIVRRGSGNSALDTAALRTVRRSAPFDRFPPAMRAAYPEWRFAYEWQFMDGGGPGRVFSDAPLDASPRR